MIELRLQAAHLIYMSSLLWWIIDDIKMHERLQSDVLILHTYKEFNVSKFRLLIDFLFGLDFP